MNEDRNKNIGAYYQSWGRYQGHPPNKIPWNLLDIVYYAFMDVSEDGEVIYGDPTGDSLNFSVFEEVNENSLDLKTMLSIGGWSYSTYFSNAALTEDSRRKFAETAVEKIREAKFNGIDIMWEYPGGGGPSGEVVRENDMHRFTLLLKKCRDLLDEAGEEDDERYMLTTAVMDSPHYYQGELETEEIAKYVDWVNVMAYDIQIDAEWSDKTNFNSPLFKTSDDPAPEDHNVSSFMEYWSGTGIPHHKLNLGIPFYGRGYANVNEKNNGLYQNHHDTPEALSEISYREIKKRYQSLEEYEYHWHPDAKVPWLYSPKNNVFITFDDPKSVSVKTDWSLNNDFGGVFAWSVDQDTLDHDLTKAVHSHVR